MQQLNFDSWYEQLENDYEDERLQKAEEAYEEYIEALGDIEHLEEVC